jgi:hypothetical protein
LEKKYPIIKKDIIDQKKYVNPYDFSMKFQIITKRSTVIIADDGGAY